MVATMNRQQRRSHGGTRKQQHYQEPEQPKALPRFDLPHLHHIPDIIEFATSPQYLDRTLFPRQATLLKIIFLETEMLTEYDYEVIGEWIQEFHLPPEDQRDEEKPLVYLGEWGIQPDILERMEILKGEGRKWFAEVLAVIGRRGGKGYIGAICGAYILWNYLCTGNPQKEYAIDRSKRLAALVFAGKKEQAKQNQWRDLVNLIIEAPCFRGHHELFVVDLISRALAESLTIFSGADIHAASRDFLSIDSTMDRASFEILPKEATPMAGRGPASFMLYFDEMAHVVATGANRGADELYDSSTPSLGQFGVDAFVYAGSSPWQMIGKFYELCQQALEVEHHTQDPVYPDKLIIQLTSWDIYTDWERAHTIPMVPKSYGIKVDVDGRGGSPEESDDERKLRHHTEYYGVYRRVGSTRKRERCFQRIKRPPAQYDAQMQKLERANPETFAVERRSRWAAALDVYLNADFVDRMFQPWPEGRHLTMQTRGVLRTTYVAHGDPSKSGANFGWAIGHVEGPDPEGLMHVVIDKIHFWAPWHFEDGQVDYIEIGEEIGNDIEAFVPEVVTFDQFNSVEIMQRLQRRARASNLPKRVDVSEQTATRPKNWAIAETFKTALGMNLIHAPYFEQLELEAKFLQDKGGRVEPPDMGPVQTKDVWDAVANVVYHLIGDQMQAFLSAEFKAAGIQGIGGPGWPGGNEPIGNAQEIADRETFEALGSFARRRQVAQTAHTPGLQKSRRRRGY